MSFLGTCLCDPQLVTFENDDYICKVASNIKEATELIEAGFEYVCEIEKQSSSGKESKMILIIAQSIWVYAEKLGMGIEPI